MDFAWAAVKLALAALALAALADSFDAAASKVDTEAGTDGMADGVEDLPVAGGTGWGVGVGVGVGAILATSISTIRARSVTTFCRKIGSSV